MENENFNDNHIEEPVAKVAAEPIKETIIETRDVINEGFLQKAKDLIDNKNEYIKRIILIEEGIFIYIKIFMNHY